jgi:hypothetical protein
MSFAAIILCVASQWVIPQVSVYFVMTQSRNVWIDPRMIIDTHFKDFILHVDLLHCFFLSPEPVRCTYVTKKHLICLHEETSADP